jgi:hypothetical protein
MTLVNLTPSDEFEFKPGQGDVLLLACGALAREIVDLIERNRWTAFDLQCLPAKWHNTPEKIVRLARNRAARGLHVDLRALWRLHGGALDRLLARRASNVSMARIAMRSSQWPSLTAPMTIRPS